MGSEGQTALSYDGDAQADGPRPLIGAFVAEAVRPNPADASQHGRGYHDRVSMKPSAAARVVRQGRWTFITNHGAVLLDLAEHPGDRLSDIAERVGISRRAVQMIISDLVEAGYVERQRVGRRNRYSVDTSRPLRHPAVSQQARVGHLLGLLNGVSGR